jgi:hypothetical protein
MPVILAVQEAEIRRIAVWSQPGQIVHETLSQKKKKNPTQKRASGMAHGVGPEFKPQYHKKKNKKIVYTGTFFFFCTCHTGTFYVMCILW